MVEINGFVVRQDRIRSSDAKISLKIADHLFLICDLSPFGLAVSSDSPLDLEDESFLGEIYVESFLFSEVRLRMVRSEQGPLGTVTALEALETAIDLESLRAMVRACSLVSLHKDKMQSIAAIPLEFRARVYEARHAMGELEKNVNALVSEISKVDYKQALLFENRYVGWWPYT